MNITSFIWYRNIIDKLLWKHHITRQEVEEVFAHSPRFTLIEKGRIKDEHLYSARGQTIAGRYVTVLFIYKTTKEALIVTARDMDAKERKNYGKK